MVGLSPLNPPNSNKNAVRWEGVEHPRKTSHNQLNNLPRSSHLGRRARAELPRVEEREVGLQGSEVTQDDSNGLEKNTGILWLESHHFYSFLL